MQKGFVISVLFAATLLLGACNGDSGSGPTPSTTVTPVPSVSPVTRPIAMTRTVTDTKTIENKDGSTTVITMYSDGSKSEVRTFKSGRLVRVTRETPVSGTRTARVTYRDDSTDVDVKDEGWVEKSMDATGDALATAARKTKAGVKTGVRETGDKAEDVGDAVKKGARKTADKAEEVGGAVKKGAKKAGSKIKGAVTPDKKEKNN